ncbi:hypothetical protein MKQ68_18095 [Chitinophaga horti]|uniref:Outer membrane protein beta-barrel domain-containing protein n=1 Tax=Chitinophaga horti TaxID=2920382 RepID=A0ABY6IX85_9BACT|nr:hypothetical protein [Chitinophaga horti]UYQ92000.1 hypothetical protein MKQ68_18095 [Chitinophaga horti]
MKQTFYIGLLACTALLCSCSDTMHIYVPNTVNAPLLQEKHEVKGNVSLSNWQVAYAVTDHVGVMANGQYLLRTGNRGDGDDNSGLFDADARGGLVEAGAGYFNRFARSRTKASIFEVYGGYGRGKFTTISYDYFADPGGNSPNRRDYRISANFDKFFVQPGFGITHHVFDFAVANRFSLLHFNKVKFGSLALIDDNSTKETLQRFDDKWVLSAEPSVTIKAGYKYVRFMGQLTFCVPMDGWPRIDADDIDADGFVDDYFQPVSINIGVAFHFAQWLKDR